ncbi:hypothetical protein SDC9_43967 [bioreactor metagenome]|uniref:Uncharacterized protein n=1 Tax=bioreactor metagenome TaxID=1076179 RepID=A0A644W502_9ZZZZ
MLVFNVLQIVAHCLRCRNFVEHGCLFGFFAENNCQQNYNADYNDIIRKRQSHQQINDDFKQAAITAATAIIATTAAGPRKNFGRQT